MNRSTASTRVSFAAILRIKADDRYVLVHAPRRPGTFSPPGGVFKYFSPAEQLLEAMGFREDRTEAFAEDMRSDLRGFIPAGSTKAFCRWFASGAYREDVAECLGRELGEELREAGLEHLLPRAMRLSFRQVRTVYEGPNAVPGASHRQIRRFDVCDLAISGPAAQQLRAELIRIGSSGTVTGVITVTTADIIYGRRGAALISGHAAYLLGAERFRPDIPAMR
jgi:hypothetical protein